MWTLMGVLCTVLCNVSVLSIVLVPQSPYNLWVGLQENELAYSTDWSLYQDKS